MRRGLQAVGRGASFRRRSLSVPGRTWRPAFVVAASYALGAVPFTNLAAQLTRGVDLRHVGNGTVSGTALYRTAGFTPLAAAGVLDVGKGAAGPLLLRDRPAAAALAGAAAVSGHNWSPFLRGAGGRGISPAMGALAVTAWPGSAILLVGLAGGRLAGETAVGSLVADAALVPALARTRGRRAAAAGLAVLVPMIVKRVLGNAPPPRRSPAVYVTRLLVDRDNLRAGGGR
ncbi:MAG: glycerol-3-phosphate acyltransferase [Carbonactinosporaceae bacterium]